LDEKGSVRGSASGKVLGVLVKGTALELEEIRCLTNCRGETLPNPGGGGGAGGVKGAALADILVF